MTNKTISINPTLFSTGGSKTKKNKDKKQKAVITPLISPNVLKNKLLKRIKEHKQRETENLENNKKGGAPTLSIPTTTSSFSDEFSDSLNYLQTLTEDKKQKEHKANSELQERRRKEKLERSTVKNYHSMGGDHQGINIELPEELSHPLMRVNTELLSASGAPVVLRDNVPYGILKGGQKPTYKDWRQTQRNNIVTNPNLALTIEGSSINREKNERENRLNVLREKLKQKQVDDSIQKDRDIMMSQNLIHNNNNNNNNNNNAVVPPTNMTAGTGPIHVPVPVQMSVPNEILMPAQNLAPNERIIATKRITKKTIKRKYTLGKSKLRKTVAVLIKDRGTRKRILAAQKDLKRKSINDIKTYLRDHNLIKTGSNAPNEVIRKLYESAMLAGEIMNSNADTLLHNFSKNDKEL
jgi:hypothetical protein